MALSERRNDLKEGRRGMRLQYKISKRRNLRLMGYRYMRDKPINTMSKKQLLAIIKYIIESAKTVDGAQ